VEQNSAGHYSPGPRYREANSTEAMSTENLWFTAIRRMPLTALRSARLGCAAERTRRCFSSGPDGDFYDSRIMQWAEKPIVRLSISRMLLSGEGQVTPERLVTTAQHVQRELSTRLARCAALPRRNQQSSSKGARRTRARCPHDSQGVCAH
jgi:hypothetical protein